MSASRVGRCDRWDFDDVCFTFGVVLPAPIALAILPLVWVCLEWSINFIKARKQAKHEDPEKELFVKQHEIHKRPTIWTRLRAFFAVLAILTTFTEFLQYVTIRRYQAFEIISGFSRILGLAICAGTYGWSKITRLCCVGVDLLSCVTAAVYVGWMIGKEIEDDPLLSFVLGILYFSFMALMTVCDVMDAIWDCKGGYKHPWLDDDEETYTVPVRFLHQYCGPFSQAWFLWMNPLLDLGKSQALSMQDLGRLPSRDETLRQYREFKTHFDINNSVFKSLFLTYKWRILFSACLAISWAGGQLIAPLCIKGVVTYLQNAYDNPNQTAPTEATLDNMLQNGWVLSFIMLIAPAAAYWAWQHSNFYTIKVGIQSGALLQLAVYDKAMQFNMNHLPAGTAGTLSSHVTADQEKIFQFCWWMHLGWVLLLQTITIIVLIYLELGWPTFIGLAVMLVILPIQSVAGKKQGGWMAQNMAKNDIRLKWITDILHAIKVIKFYAWEPALHSVVNEHREIQLSKVWHYRLWQSCLFSLGRSVPVLITVASYATYGSVYPDKLDPARVFSTLSLFNLLQIPMFLIPMSITLTINFLVSLGRIQKTLSIPSFDNSFVRFPSNKSGGVKMINCRFQYPDLSQEGGGDDKKEKKKKKGKQGKYEKIQQTSDSEKRPASPTSPSSPREFPLHFELAKGSLCLIIGPVGSGKSTLLSGLLGEVSQINPDGFVEIGGSVAYAAQQPFIMNSTLKENIIFQQPYNELAYQSAIYSCGLEDDLKQLPAGDQTEIGDRGINLSGGQKQRVNMARAVYANADIVIFDDPLSALDMHVGQHVFQHVMLDLRKQSKTVIMSTHQLQYLPEADLVILMNRGGTIVDQGTAEQLEQRGHDIYGMVKAVERGSLEIKDDDTDDAKPKKGEKEGKDGKKKDDDTTSTKEDKGKLTTKEDRQTGAVKAKVYMTYVRACGYLSIIFVTVMYGVAQGTQVGANIWLSYWTSEETEDAEKKGIGFYVGIYLAFAIIMLFVTFAREVTVARTALRASRKLHGQLLDRVLRAPMEIFDTTPVGRILNRFSTDFIAVDQNLPDFMSQLGNMASGLIAGLLLITAATPVFLVFLAPLSIAYIYLQWYYRKSSRELQRLDAMNSSPILAQFTQTLAGIQTIRAFGACQQSLLQLAKKVDAKALTYLMTNTSQRWLGVRLDFIGVVIVFATALSCCIQSGTIDPSFAGLAMAYSTSITFMLNFLVVRIAMVEMQMASVERIGTFVQWKVELPPIGSSITSMHQEGIVVNVPTSDWPQFGAIQINNLQVRYREGTPTVLKGITVNIKQGEKIGICGRTGSGKSSLLMALYRMLDIIGGNVLIDGMDCATVPLSLLRSRLGIIPQDPVLFAGTVRYNVDPLNLYTDEDIVEALKIAQLKDAVSSLEDPVTANGENFSVGQRQLFCFARAIVHKTTILCLDEATASVDNETDNIIQQLLRKPPFSGLTILTIAHRIATILDYDKILVLDEGKVAEFAPPAELMAMETSTFKSLVVAAGAADVENMPPSPVDHVPL